METIILAAGKGERLGNLTKDTPKTLLEIEGSPIINFTIKVLSKSKNLDKIVINIQKDFKDVYVSKIDYDTKKINIVYNTDYNENILDALKNNVEKISGNAFLLLFGDSIIDIDIDKLIDFYNMNEGKYSVLITSPKTYQAIGIEMKKNIARSIFTKKVNSYDVCGAILNKNDINWNIKGDLLDLIYKDLAKRKKLKAYKFFGYYKNINIFKDVVDAENDLRDGKISFLSTWT